MEYEARFTRIETALDRLIEVQSAQARNLENLAGIMGSVIISQQNTDAKMANLVEAQAKTGEHLNDLTIKSAETQAKLDALIHRWDEMIRERGRKSGSSEPPPVN